jgi:ABC-type oligopeptide transport system substrate-binding subunit
MKPHDILALSAIALVAAACSSSSSTKSETAPAPAAAAAAAPGAGGTAGDTVVNTEVLVNVINNFIPPSAVTVYVVGPSVGRMLLGNVSIKQTKAFTFKAGNLNGDYKLIAEAQGSGKQFSSQRFNLAPNLRFVQWQMDVNSIVQYETPN